MAIKLIVGLGNIGTEHEDDRHNAGFWFVDALAREAGAMFKNERGFHGVVARLSNAAAGTWLLKPSTYMNRSGQAVLALANFYKILPDEILVAHDEMDLPPGGIKMKKGGGHAGHNGLKDIGARLATNDFWRLRIGVGHPRALQLEQEVIDFVLHRPSREHQTLIDEAMAKAVPLMPHAVAGDMEVAMMKLHSKPRAEPKQGAAPRPEPKQRPGAAPATATAIAMAAAAATAAATTATMAASPAAAAPPATPANKRD